MFARELPGTGCKWHNDDTGGLDFNIFARRTDIDDEPTPDPAVYDAFLLLSWVFAINVNRTLFSILYTTVIKNRTVL